VPCLQLHLPYKYLLHPVIIKSRSNSWGQHDALVCNWGEAKIPGTRIPLEQSIPDRTVDSNSSSWRPSNIWQEDDSLLEQKTLYDTVSLYNWGEPQIPEAHLKRQDMLDQDTLVDSDNSSWRRSLVWQKDSSIPKQETYAPVSNEILNTTSSEHLEVSKLHAST
jgi:hypothetical protein